MIEQHTAYDKSSPTLENRKSYLKALRNLYESAKIRAREVTALVRTSKKGKLKFKAIRKLKQIKSLREEIKQMFYSVTLANEQDWRALKPEAIAVYESASKSIQPKV